MKSDDINMNPIPYPIGSGQACTLTTAVNYVQVVCGVCKVPINIQYDNYQINDVHSCWECYRDHEISKNVMKCPYRQPRSRKFALRVPKISTTFSTTVAQTQDEFMKSQPGVR